MCQSHISLVVAIAIFITTGQAALAQTPAATPVAPPGSSQTTGETQTPTFTLDVVAAASQDVALTVRSPSRIPFKIIRGGNPAPGDATLDLSSFINDQGVVQPFTVSIGDTAGVDHVENLAFKAPVLPVNLNVPPNLPAGGKYTGRMIPTVPGQPQPMVWRFLLTPVEDLRPATLVLDRNAVTVTAIRPVFCWPFYSGGCVGDDPAIVTVHVRDKTGDWPLNAITARVESSAGSTSTEVDQTKIVSATFNGQQRGDIFASPAPGTPRDVAAHEQKAITLTFDRDISPGEYTIPLRFTAANSGDDDTQRLTVTLKVRDPVIWAIVILVLAALLSFLATRVVTMLRQRASFLARVHAMRPGWLARDPQTLPVIGLRATLKQAEDLCRPFWLTGQKEIDARLTAAARMLAILDRVRHVRARIDAISVQMVKERASWKLDEFADQLDATPLREQDVAPLNTQLDKFDDWCASGSDKQMTAYWEDVSAHINACLSQSKLVSTAAARRLEDSLRDKLEAIKAKPDTLSKMTEDDIISRRLGLLWEARGHPGWITSIVELHPDPPKEWSPIDDVYRVIDDGRWKILKDRQKVLCKVEGPSTSTLDPPAAYETVVFRLDVVATDEADKDLLTTYLMQKKLTYLWTITISADRPGSRRGKAGKPDKLMVRSTQPQVAQYSPAKGQLSASVKIDYRSDHGRDADSAAVDIGASDDFRAWRITQRADAIGSLVALLVSVVSGIKLYALGATFGSLTDYLALFTWGASLDQGKNFVQSLAVYSADASTTPAAVTPAAGTNS